MKPAQHFQYGDNGSIDHSRNEYYHRDGFEISQSQKPSNGGCFSWVCCCFKPQEKVSNVNPGYQNNWVANGNAIPVPYPQAAQAGMEFKTADNQQLPLKLTLSPRHEPKSNSRSNSRSGDRRKNKTKAKRKVNSFDEVQEEVIWEAHFSDGWRAYTANISQEIEKVHRRTRSPDLDVLEDKTWWLNESFFYKHNQHKISPHFMLQRNISTGRDRKIRRVKIEMSSKANERTVSSRRLRAASPRSKSSLYAKDLPHRKTSPRGSQRQRVKKRRKKPGMRRFTDPDFKHDRYTHRVNAFNETINFSDYRNWKTAHVVSWLRILNYPQYCDVVREKGVTGRDLSRVGITHLVTELGMSVEHATHIFGALEGIKSGFMEHKEKTPRRNDRYGNQFFPTSENRTKSLPRDVRLSLNDFYLNDDNAGHSIVLNRGDYSDVVSVASQNVEPPPFLVDSMYNSKGDSKVEHYDEQQVFQNEHKHGQYIVTRTNSSDWSHTGKRKQNPVPDSPFERWSCLHDNEKRADSTFGDKKLNERAIQIDENGHRTFIDEEEEIEIPVFEKEHTFTSEDATQKIHDSSSSSQSEKDAYHKPLKQISEEKCRSRDEWLDDEAISGHTTGSMFETRKRESSDQLQDWQKAQQHGTTVNNSLREALAFASAELSRLDSGLQENSDHEKKVSGKADKDKVDSPLDLEMEENIHSASTGEDTKGLGSSVQVEMTNPHS